MPDRVPEDMPDKMPEDMSDRMPEDLPVTKRIDVMVGITRSNVFFAWYLMFSMMLSVMFYNVLFFDCHCRPSIKTEQLYCNVPSGKRLHSY
jgi:hypothetical protein